MFNPVLASDKDILFGSVRYFWASPDAARASVNVTRGGCDVVDVEVFVEDVAFRRVFRKSLTCVESTVVPNVFRNCPNELSFAAVVGS